MDNANQVEVEITVGQVWTTKNGKGTYRTIKITVAPSMSPMGYVSVGGARWMKAKNGWSGVNTSFSVREIQQDYILTEGK